MATVTRANIKTQGVFEHMGVHDQEQLVFNYHGPSGLRAIIAIDSTALGPAIGGTRMYPYPSEAEAIRDVLRLARAMTYKAAAAGLNFGGGKAVILGDPRRDKTEELFRAFGRFIHSLGGRYITSTDMGTTQEDLIVMRQETPFVTGLPESMGGSGDTAIPTAMGIWMGMKACAKEVYGSDSLSGRRIAVQGVGKIGYNLVHYLVEDGAQVIVTDTDEDSLKRVQGQFKVEIVGPEEIYSLPCHIFSPNAIGGILNDETIPQLQASIVAGGANNQLAEPRHGLMLHQRHILYAPDYVINSGGLINVCDELHGYCQERAHDRVHQIPSALTRIFATSRREGMPPSQAADEVAEQRIKAIREVHRIYVANPQHVFYPLGASREFNNNRGGQ